MKFELQPHQGRWIIKGVCLAIFVYACVQLMRFQQFLQGTGPEVTRPEIVAGILPVGHFTSFFAWIKGGGWDTLLPAGLVIIIGALLVSLLFKRGFCGYICPVGTFWEIFAEVGKKLLGKNYKMPKWLDWIGRGAQVVLVAAMVGWLALVSVSEAVWFRDLPYMWIADMKIIQGFASPVFLCAIVICAAISFLFSPLWCRYVCPVGGLYAIVGLASPATICRNEDACIGCERCAKACHTFVDPSTVKTVRSTVCDGCMECVDVCPVKGCLEPRLAGKVKIEPWVWVIGVIVVWTAVYLIALALGQWHTTLSVEQFRVGVMQFLNTETPGFF